MKTVKKRISKKDKKLEEAKAIRFAARKFNAAMVKHLATKYDCSVRRVYRILNDEILTG